MFSENRHLLRNTQIVVYCAAVVIWFNTNKKQEELQGQPHMEIQTAESDIIASFEGNNILKDTVV